MAGIASAAAFGPQIRAARKAYGLTQAEVAMTTNCSVKFLIDLERGKATAPLNKVLAVIHALGGRVEIRFPDPPNEDGKIDWA
ncbi:helix-turn-helix domain-containing protein [Lichenicoccus roseus]|uniref:Helix-turn-helix transcriptional regulator n=1 Tax=Lichenicoccus roseus TaxID=2683649 RepID=A0A5R9J1W9_9PROT|nr:helix-turn-helix domain-containing protein [Lichenicoccus roseus]TLU71552.1 helix-turn-helix transcriptional regulator [Lichenicoccus roseus]